MKLPPRYNPFMHDDPEFDVKLPSAHRGRNWPLVGIVILSLAIWCAVFWLADHASAIWGGR